MKNEHPILFSTAMVTAILEGRKTMTRRIVKPQPPENCNEPIFDENGYGFFFEGLDTEGDCDDQFPQNDSGIQCPYGGIGSILWVRETFAFATDFGNSTDRIFYKASYENGGIYDDVKKWKPSIFMPRTASRISLEITDIRVERVQDITEEDAIAEGIVEIAMSFVGGGRMSGYGVAGATAKDVFSTRIGAFQNLWNKINGKRASWESNPWVWVISFKRTKP
jgi:hypothetical protein